MAKLASRPRDSLSNDLGEEDDHAAWLETRRAMERRSLRSTPDGPRRDLPLDLAKAALRLALKLCGLWQPSLANGLDVRYRTVELGLARLPCEFDGYRILHITDPHFDAAARAEPGVLPDVMRFPYPDHRGRPATTRNALLTDLVMPPPIASPSQS